VSPLRQYVPSKDPLQRLEDILENIARIDQYTKGLDAAAFVEDRMVYDAVERCLERISEAAKSSERSQKRIAPTFPGPKFALSATFCVTNTTASRANVFGS
jgi:uncharacterized protein with HEPN domain